MPIFKGFVNRLLGCNDVQTDTSGEQYEQGCEEKGCVSSGLANSLLTRSIKGVYRNDMITKLGDYALANCFGLTGADFPNVTVMGVAALGGCNLETVQLPKVTTLPAQAFAGDSKLVEVKLGPLTGIGKNAFQATALVEASFPLVTEMGEGAFYKCAALKKAFFPKLEAVPNMAFNVCTALEYADFGVVTDIGMSAFVSCTALTTLILRSETMAKCSFTNVCSATPIGSGTGYIYVPAALTDAYKADSKWKTYANQFRALEDFTVDGTITGYLDWNKIVAANAAAASAAATE